MQARLDHRTRWRIGGEQSSRPCRQGGGHQVRVYIHETSYRRAGDAIGRVFASINPDLAGKRVLIKPNALSDREPETGANTHPAVLAAVIEAVRAAGPAQIMVGDNPGQANYGNIDRLFASNGLGEVAGTHLVNMGLDLVPRRIPSLDYDLYFPRLLFEVDYVINLPKLKVHQGTGLTAAIKNTFGYLPGAQKARCHVVAPDRRGFERIVADIYRLRPPDLNILDGVVMVEGQVEVGTSLRYIGRLLAAESGVALDVLAATMVGLEPASLYHLAAAAGDEGLSLRADDYELVGDWQVIPDVRVPPGFGPGETRPTAASSPGLLASASRTVLVLDRALCAACAECVRACPTGARTMDAGAPAIAGHLCASCCACMEACELDACNLEADDPAG